MMSTVQTVFIYAISCSAVMVYGFGLERSFFESRRGSRFYSRLPILLITALASIAVLWPLITAVLIPYRYDFLVPVLGIIVYSVIQLICLSIFRRNVEAPAGERVFLFGTVYLSLYEGISFVDSLIIAVAAVLSFSLVTTMLFAIRERIAPSDVQAGWKGIPIILICMGLLSLAFYGSDVSWWCSGGAR